jgi:hypothetical protein
MASITTRAFIVGCPRSGTTLLRDLLGAHPNVMVFPESHFFARLEASRPIARRLRLASRRAPRALSRFLGSLEDPPDVDLPRLPLVRSYVRLFVRLLDGASTAQGATVWVEKTPRHLNYIDLIESELPNPKFIHLVRSGEDVVASVYEQTQTGLKPWWGVKFPTLDDCIRLWNRSLEVTQRHVSKPNHLVVSYDDLVTNPTFHLQRTCSFLGVTFDERMASSRELRYEPRAKFKRLFTEEQQSYILKHL